MKTIQKTSSQDLDHLMISNHIQTKGDEITHDQDQGPYQEVEHLQMTEIEDLSLQMTWRMIDNYQIYFMFCL